MKNIKILLAPTLDIATKVSAEATVEAEYGNTVVKGSLVTLAHHAEEYKGQPAPCNTPNVPVLEDGSTILISHIDLDTIGGIMKLTGDYTDDPTFWSGAEFIDLNGQHHVNELPTKAILHLQAYWAWVAVEGRAPRYIELTDVTDFVQKHIETIVQICDGDPGLITNGQTWALKKAKAQEGCLYEESNTYRAFITDDFSKQCPTAYYSFSLEKVIPVTITLNTTTKAITIGCCDNSLNACKCAQELWGKEAGGHAGVAGSPRGKEMTKDDLLSVIDFIKSR